MDCFPWSFERDFKDILILYGRDTALAMSLSREFDFDTADDISILYSEDLFGESKPVRIMCTNKTAEDISKRYIKNEFLRKCILVVEGSAPKTHIKTGVYVKCDELNKRTRGYFIKAWNKILGTNLEYDEEINNLDDFKWMKLKQSLGDGSSFSLADEYSIWNIIRTEQFRNTKFYQSIFRHFELWARNTIPNDETLQLCYDKVKSEIERFKNEVSPGY